MPDLTTGQYTQSQIPQEQALLPENRTALERDECKVQQSIVDLPVLIKQFFDPMQCAEENLPWLASANAVDLWYSDWTEARKRSIISNIYDLKKDKGTKQGIVNYLGYVDTDVLMTYQPPSRGWYRGAMTDAQRQSWLTSLPQIRVYPYISGRVAPARRAFFGNANWMVKRDFYAVISKTDDPDFTGTVPASYSFMQPSYGAELMTNNAFFVDPVSAPNTLVPCRYVTYTDPVNPGIPTEEVSITSYGSRKTFMGSGYLSNPGSATPTYTFMQTTDGGDNTIRVRMDPAAAMQYATFSGDAAYNVRPIAVMQGRTVLKPRSFFRLGLNPWSHFRDAKNDISSFMQPSYADWLIYNKISIYDPTRTPQMQQARSFYNYARLGIDPFTAEMVVSIKMSRPQNCPVFKYGFMTGFMKSWDRTPLDRALDAIHISKELHSKILVQPQAHKVVTLGDGYRLGEFKLGQIISTIKGVQV